MNFIKHSQNLMLNSNLPVALPLLIYLYSLMLIEDTFTLYLPVD